MENDLLTPDEGLILLGLARQALEFNVRGDPLPDLALDDFPPKLRRQGATFVTLTKLGILRGCIGTLEPYRPLIEDVRQHAIAAAFNDYRFPDVLPEELRQISIEVSCLSVAKPLKFQSPNELLQKVRPGVDGVVLRAGRRRSTFLPQVWEKLPEATQFMNQLSLKMGAPAECWRSGNLIVETYQVQEFYE